MPNSQSHDFSSENFPSRDKGGKFMNTSEVEDNDLSSLFSTELHSEYTRTRHISTSGTIALTCDSTVKDIELYNLSRSFNSVYLLPTSHSPIPDNIVTQQNWTNIAQSPAVSFLSRFSPSEELLHSWSRLFDDDMNIKDNSVLKDKYIIGKIIGQGTFTESREGIPIVSGGFPDPVVLKIAKFLPGTESAQKICTLFTKEISIWKTLEHSNILPLQDLLTCSGMIIAVSPMAVKGDLLKLFQRNRCLLPFIVIKKYMKQVANSLYYLHMEKYVIHRDIKLENILVHDKDHVYLCDFGLSESMERLHFNEFSPAISKRCSISSLVNEKYSTDYGCTCTCYNCNIFESSISSSKSQDDCKSCILQQLQYFCTGSLWYCPPEELVPELKLEVLNCECEKKHNGPKVDIWAFGVCLYALIKGKFPFADEFIPRLQKKVQSGIFEPISSFPGIDDTELDNLNELIACCLQVNRNNRWDIQQVISSKFFKYV